MGNYIDATEYARKIESGELSPVELVQSAIDKAERLNPTINAIVHERFDKALAEANSPQLAKTIFHGVPVLVKDLGAEIAGEPHTQGSALLKHFDYRAQVDSHIYKRLKRAGLIAIGRTNCPEFGTTITTEPVAFGPTRNPWNTNFSAGGSSGGSAAAVAAGIVTIAHGNDGGGSIRIPASACGLVGLKPTRGRVSLGPAETEHWAGASVDHVLSATVRDSATLLDILSGYESGDPYVAPHTTNSFADLLRVNQGPLRIGFLDRPLMADARPNEECSQAVRICIRLLEEMGHHIEDAYPKALEDDKFPGHFINFVSAMVATDVANWSVLLDSPLDVTQLEPTNQFYYAVGMALSAPSYLQIINYFGQFRRQVLRFWDEEHFDVLVTPTLAKPPAEIGYLADPVESSTRVLEYLQFTPQFNITGQPAISLPLGISATGLPIGVQLVANYGREDLLLSLANSLETVSSFADALPKL